MSEPFTVCPVCREIVDPADTMLQYAVELERVDTFGGSEYVQKLGAFFHPRCYEIVHGWRAKPHPA
jgi:hypothetical protein